MKRVLLLCVVIFFVGACVSSPGVNKDPINNKENPALLQMKNGKVERIASVPDGGDKVVLADSMVLFLVDDLIKMKVIQKSDKESLGKVFKKFFPMGGMLSFTDSVEETNSFGLSYYKKSNDIRLTFLARGLVYKYFLKKDKSLKKKVRVRFE